MSTSSTQNNYSNSSRHSNQELEKQKDSKKLISKSNTLNKDAFLKGTPLG